MRTFRSIAPLTASGLVFVLAVNAGPASGKDAAPALAPDAIYFNGKVITVDARFSVAQAFAVAGDRFVSVGADDAIRKLAGHGSRLVDLHGATVVPGLSDAHDHLFAIERLRRGVDLSGATTTEEVLGRLAPAVRAASPGQVVVGSTGWRAPIKRHDLDELAPTTPVIVYRMRRGPALMNSAALRRLGVTGSSKTFMGYEFPADAAGELTGETPDWPGGLLAADALVPPLTHEQEEQTILRGQKERNALGLTQIRDLSNLPAWSRAYLRLWRSGKLTVRVSLGASLPDRIDPLALAREQMIGPVLSDAWLDFTTLGEEPSPEILGGERFARFALEANRLGWRISPHVGNPDMEASIGAFEAVDRDQPLKGRRWVIEHMNGITPAQMDRLAKMGVIVSIQSLPANHRAELVAALGEAEADRQVPAREMLQHGLVLISGTDAAGNAPGGDGDSNPFRRMAFFVTRRTPDGHVMGPAEAVSREAALRFATINAAYASFREDQEGSIEPGKLADFVVLSDDYLTVPDTQIQNVHAVATFIGGRCVFASPETRLGS